MSSDMDAFEREAERRIAALEEAFRVARLASDAAALLREHQRWSDAVVLYRRTRKEKR